MDGIDDRQYPEFSRVAGWEDHVQPKAIRLLRGNQVKVLRNGETDVIGHVIGDTGEYQTEIKRDDPNSRAITGWHCECAWNQFAWQRTRQWKQYEGRPCSHVLATYWKSLSTPLDDVADEDLAGTGQKKGPYVPPTGAPSLPPGTQTTFDPNEPDPSQSPEPVLTPEEAQLMGRPAPKAPPGEKLPMSPADQYAAMQPAVPGTSPAGMPAPPNVSVSVPGARPQTPSNPIQWPGMPGSGTLSSVKTSESAPESFEPPEIVRTTVPVVGLAEGKSEEHGAGQYQEIPAGATGEVMSQDPTLGWVECIFPLDGGELTPYHVRVFCDPADLKKTKIRPPGPFIRRRR
jgi:hypothetical protein